MQVLINSFLLKVTEHPSSPVLGPHNTAGFVLFGIAGQVERKVFDYSYLDKAPLPPLPTPLIEVTSFHLYTM